MSIGSAGNRGARFHMGCYALMLPTLAMLGIFLFIPIVWAFSKSFYDFEVGDTNPEWIGLGNYIEFLSQDVGAWASLGHMLFLTAFAVVVRLVVPLLVAKLIISLKHERWRHFYRIMFLAPIVVPAVAIMLIWKDLVYSEVGLLNELLGVLGLASMQAGWLTDPNWALLCIAFVGFPFAGGFEVLIFYAGLAGVPESVNDSARLDGATGMRKFVTIDLPMVLSQVRLIVALTIIWGVQTFEGILILTEGAPGFKTMVPGLSMYYNAFSYQRMGYACAIGVVLFMMIAGLTVVNLKYLRHSEEDSA